MRSRARAASSCVAVSPKIEAAAREIVKRNVATWWRLLLYR